LWIARREREGGRAVGVSGRRRGGKGMDDWTLPVTGERTTPASRIWKRHPPGLGPRMPIIRGGGWGWWMQERENQKVRERVREKRQKEEIERERGKGGERERESARGEASERSCQWRASARCDAPDRTASRFPIYAFPTPSRGAATLARPPFPAWSPHRE